ncbi:hypothetical protein, partial [Aliivibrio fischeri]|uniref:hypothetical protein n=1 Tax=Aliivibrio fischeri TaxID=668 RepID=UPI001BDF1CC6
RETKPLLKVIYAPFGRVVPNLLKISVIIYKNGLGLAQLNGCAGQAPKIKRLWGGSCLTLGLHVYFGSPV